MDIKRRQCKNCLPDQRQSQNQNLQETGRLGCPTCRSLRLAASLLQRFLKGDEEEERGQQRSGRLGGSAPDTDASLQPEPCPTCRLLETGGFPLITSYSNDFLKATKR
ncbi:hypothetical protein E2C01_071808 [Portunus trituberculatus]|uniref:Uncharacterized protein n=1 Tax=Portunus trituberculatus TaxID=210409 RepID=A0A5B7I613_PORTR|nr:hypothetical protein [Portunus trituberculatus]